MLLAGTVALAGCGMTAAPTTGASGLAALQGRVQGGQQPISGATIYLYAAGATGNGTGAANLLTTAVTTDANGNFSITNDYSCPTSATQVYLVASGGNPGISVTTNNTASLLMVALGDCGLLATTNYIFMDEVTTAAAAWALAQFVGPNANVGATATNATGLRNAFMVANSLANSTTGVAGGVNLPTGATIESQKLYALANVLSACVNTAGGAACSPLFSAATEHGVTPSNTLDAALNIVRNPGSQVLAVFNASAAMPPFQPALTAAPHDWTMSIKYTGNGMALPTALGVDSTGSVWVANYSTSIGGTAAKFSPVGAAAAGSPYADPILYESYGLTVDPYDNVWITNQQSHHALNSGDGALTEFNSQGTLLSGAGIGSTIYYPYSVASDASGNIWVADYGRSQASLLNQSGVAEYTSPYMSSSLPLPVAVTVDAAGNGWFAAESSAVRVTPTGTVTEFVCCREPSGIAVDQNGYVWVSDYAASAVVQLNASGTVVQTVSGVGGVYYPESLAIDGAGNVWTANYHGETISGFTAAAPPATMSSAISPSGGFGLDAGLASPFGIALDASGNVWVTSFAGASLTQFVGLASPVKTPLDGPPSQP